MQNKYNNIFNLYHELNAKAFHTGLYHLDNIINSFKFYELELVNKCNGKLPKIKLDYKRSFKNVLIIILNDLIKRLSKKHPLTNMDIAIEFKNTCNKYNIQYRYALKRAFCWHLNDDVDINLRNQFTSDFKRMCTNARTSYLMKQNKLVTYLKKNVHPKVTYPAAKCISRIFFYLGCHILRKSYRHCIYEQQKFLCEHFISVNVICD